MSIFDHKLKNSGRFVLLILYRSTMVIGIGHRRQNITPTEAIKGGIKSLYIIDEPGTAASAMKSKEFDETKGSHTQA